MRNRNQISTVLLSLLLGACTTFQAEVAETAVQVQPVVEAEVTVPTAKIEVISPHDSNLLISADYFDFSLPDNIIEKSPFVGSAQPELVEIVDRRKINLASKMAQTRESIVLQRRQAAALRALAELEKNNGAWYRLQQGMQLEPVLNDRVIAQLSWYLNNRGYLERVMQRARLVLPFILDELEKDNLPTELALLPIVESAYQTFAYSHGRASGMWQIIPSTGRFLGLKQNWWYDGRRDIIESTRAAIRYLKTLAGEFNGDWDLALASYNAGPGKIRRAVLYNKKRKRQTDFWNLTKIRRETRNYVPKLYALKELFGHPKRYQLELLPISNEPVLEVVELGQQIDLALAADLAGITINELYQYNPAFNRWATSPNGPHRLLLPRNKSAQFKLALKEIPVEKHINWVRHKIKPGETLSEISRKYRTTTALIKSVNKIRGTQIRAGKYLTIATATKSLKSYTLSQSARVSKIQNTRRSGTKQVHVVRRGQSLWSISQRYGVSTNALAKWNGIAPIDTLRVGQKLTVWINRQAVLVQTVATLIATGPNQGLQALRYTVRKGDSLYRIANKFNIRVTDIKRWNKIGKYLQPGQKIKLFVDITRQSG
ncbi:MAG: LysM peptidoglycan-binding domain-containing protein [Proteobacteria bacterium]|nr:LysM peptidoglycan-binding domain-containing protein [Pseudomonadota bacterium]